MNDKTAGPVILFDGVCNLCSASVLFIIKRDRQGKFHFASLQSHFGQQQLLNHKLDPEQMYSVMLIIGETIYEKSRAALEITRRLPGLWPLLYIFIIVPPFIRNWVYDFISSNRYKWFGKKDQCMIPTPELRSRFID